MNFFPDGFEPTSKEILCGRGKGNLRHEGNQYFMKIIRANLQRYTDAPKRIDKSLVVSLIVSSIKDEGYNFVRQDTKTQRWFTLTEPQVHEKTGHAIRDILKKNKGAPPQNQSKQAILQAADEPDVVASQILSTALKVSKLVEKSKLDFAALSAAQQPMQVNFVAAPQPPIEPLRLSSREFRRSSVLKLFDNLSPEEFQFGDQQQFHNNNTFNNNNFNNNFNNNMMVNNQPQFDQPLPLNTRNSSGLRSSDMMQVFDALSPPEEPSTEVDHKTKAARRASSREFRRSELLQFLDLTEEELEEAEKLGIEKDAAMTASAPVASAQARATDGAGQNNPLPIDARTSDTLNALFKDQEEIFNNLQNIFTILPDNQDENNVNDHEMEERSSRASQMLGELLKRQEGLFDELHKLDSELNVDV